MAHQFDMRPNPTTGVITGAVYGSNQILCGNVCSTPRCSAGRTGSQTSVPLLRDRSRFVLLVEQGVTPDNLYHRYFQPVLSKAGLRKIRLHDLRHTFGSLLIQSGASIVYVKEQMGHSSIQVTVDIYGHLIPSANVSFVDRLDEAVKQEEKTTLQQNATQAQLAKNREDMIPPEVADLIGGGGRTRTYDLRIMRPSL